MGRRDRFGVHERLDLTRLSRFALNWKFFGVVEDLRNEGAHEFSEDMSDELAFNRMVYDPEDDECV